MAIEVIPNTVPAGAEIRGLDIGRGLGEDEFSQLRAALHEHAVVFMRCQDITSQQLLDLTARFGTIKPARPETQFLVPGYPQVERLSNIVDEDGKHIGLVDAGQYWHSDRSYQVVPNGYAILYAIEVPRNPAGEPLGGTMFVSSGHAYDTLSQAMKDRIENLTALHSYLNPTQKGNGPAYRSSTSEDIPPVSQPVVRRHPVTGRKCLFVSEQYAYRIEGLPEAESRELLDHLCAHATRPELRYTHRWQEGDLLIWDDCAVQHNAVADYKLPQRRMIVRTTVLGTQASGKAVSHQAAMA
jgi:taurine dioxygenase